MSELPWSKFFWSDWESDQGLRLCSLAAQGLWMRMLCVCAKGDPRGYLAINGKPLDSTDVARLCGISAEEVEPLMDELHLNGVFSRDRRGWIYNRRMLKDAKKSATGKKFANKRWSQADESKKKKPAPNGVPKGTPMPQSPEARSQRDNNSEDKSSSLSSSRGPRDNDGYQKFLEVHPKPRETARGEQAWQEAIEAGNAAGALIAAAQRYATAARTFDPDKVKYSDNWLAEGTWRRYPPKTSKTHDEADVLKFWAGKIKSGVAFGLSEEMAHRCKAAGLVTHDEIEAARQRISG